MFMCGFCVQRLCVVVYVRERERHHHKPMASAAETNGPAIETQTHSLITKHIQLNIKNHHNSQTQKPIYPYIKQMGQQVKLEEA